MTNTFVFALTVASLLASSNGSSRRPCEPCPNSEYPVCATNGTHWFLFRNGCRLDAENDKRGQNGDITLQRTEIANCFQKCDQVCTNEYAPICATWGDNTYTFLNRCELDLENCNVGNIWSILHEGECPPSVSSSTSPPTTLPPPTSTTTTTTPSPTSRPPPPRPQPLPPTTLAPEGCPTYCTMEYAPVCGTTGDRDRTFSNMCLFQVEACTSRQNWQVKGYGVCNESAPVCDEACPKIYSPLCATFNGQMKSFDNECLLDLENCKTGCQWDIVYKGECRGSSDNCPSACPEIYQPVCAIGPNGERRTFPNVCFLNRDICRTNQDWQIENSGECPTSPPTPAPAPECPRNYQPVCAACNGVQQTFSNRCAMNVDMRKTGIAWQVIYDGACTVPPPTATTPTTTTTTTPPAPTQVTSPSPPPCPDACPAYYNPVCASSMGNIRTFSNGCELSVESCKTGRTWKVLFNGRCEDQYGSDVQGSGTSVCPSIYDPICAAFNGETKTFSNKCQMDAEIATTNTPWEIVATSECEKLPSEYQPTGPCPKCSNYYQPVCAFQQGEQKTFTNECHMLAENCYQNSQWVVVYDGECKVSDKPRNCPNICPLTYNPVCAVYNGVRRTFQNECELNHESYKTGAEWVIIGSGECDYCQMCPDQIDPICAEYNGQTKTFDSACLMEYENCKTGNEWRVIYKSVCTAEVCPGYCPNVYQPVCATNSSGGSRTFNSECEMRMESCHSDTQWNLQLNGECPSVDESCPSQCKVDFQPLCATNQREYQSFVNECFLKSWNCNSDSDTWVISHRGECTDDEVVQQSQPVQSYQIQISQSSQSSQPTQQSQPSQQSQPIQQSQPNQSSQPSPSPTPSQQSIQISGSVQASQVYEIPPMDAEIINQILNRLPSDSGVSYGTLSEAQPQQNQPTGNSASSSQTPANSPAASQPSSSQSQPPSSQSQQPSYQNQSPSSQSQPPSSQQMASQTSTSPQRCRIVPCVAVYNPVCGTFNGVERTFSNPCSLNNFNCRYSENWQTVYNGFCERSIETQY